ncbi:MAG: alpha/beta fold hydrolase [Actinobacteria bacterium]|nr:alpha/beta fold hydrolase [Actinomycetota bacterium]
MRTIETLQHHTDRVDGEPEASDAVDHRHRTPWPERAALGAGGAAAVATCFDGPLPWAAVRGAVLLTVTVAIVGGARRMRTRVGASAIGALGLAATVFGAGVGVPNLMASGASVVGWVGSAALVAGLTAFVSSIVAALRHTRWWTKVATIPAVLVGTAVFGMPVTVALINSDVAPIPLGDRTPSSVGLQYLDVELVTADDVDLAAWYVPSTNGAAVVMLAGAGSTRSDEVDRAAAIARHGYGVLLLDVRGHGGSGGEAMLYGWYGERDVRPAIDYLLARPDVTGGRVGVIGMSMGGQQAVAAFGADTRIRAEVADGVVGRHTSEIEAPNPVDRFMGWLMSATSEVLTSAPHPTPLRESVRSAAPHRLLVIAGERVGLERDFARTLVDASPGSVEVWIAPDSGHTEGFARYPQEWERRVVGFLDEQLRAG